MCRNRASVLKFSLCKRVDAVQCRGNPKIKHYILAVRVIHPITCVHTGIECSEGYTLHCWIMPVIVAGLGQFTGTRWLRCVSMGDCWVVNACVHLACIPAARGNWVWRDRRSGKLLRSLHGRGRRGICGADYRLFLDVDNDLAPL